jgi:hypothetical protein
VTGVCFVGMPKPVQEIRCGGVSAFVAAAAPAPEDLPDLGDGGGLRLPRPSFTLPATFQPHYTANQKAAVTETAFFDYQLSPDRA